MSDLLKLTNPTPSRVIQLSDGEGFAVRGISPVQVFSLYGRHTGQLGAIFDRVMDGMKDGGKAQPEDIESVVLGMIKDAPIILGELLVLATGGSPSDEAEFEAALDIAMKLPFPVQAAAFKAIGDLTFTSDMPPGEFVRLITDMAQKVTESLKKDQGA